MKTLIFIAIVFAGLLATGCTTTYLSLTENNKVQIEQKLNDYEPEANEGTELILTLMNGTEINGELLSVRDRTITLSTEHSATEDELANLTYPITTVRNDEIQEMTIEGSNYVLAGLFAGLVGGFGAAYGLGRAFNEPGKYTGLGVFLIVWPAAIIAGPIVGYLLSTDDIILQEIPLGYDWSILKPIARYPDEEPEYLKAID